MVPWASPKRLKPHSTTNYWALTSTSKKVFSLPPSLYSAQCCITVPEMRFSENAKYWRGHCTALRLVVASVFNVPLQLRTESTT